VVLGQQGEMPGLASRRWEEKHRKSCTVRLEAGSTEGCTLADIHQKVVDIRCSVVDIRRQAVDIPGQVVDTLGQNKDLEDQTAADTEAHLEVGMWT